MRVLELSHFESVPTRGTELHELGMLFSNVSAYESSYGGNNTLTGRQIFDQFSNRVAKSS